MKKLKTIVVEDERLPRLSLLAKLEDYRDVLDVADACDSYESARDSILRHRPDLLFLDIQLQGRDSIQLLEELRTTIDLPYIIFTTAYSDRNYLMSAIKLSAVDYLLKPVGREDLAHAIAKVSDRARTIAAARGEETDKLSFRSVGGKIFVAAGQVACFKADGNYSKILTFGGEDLVLESLHSIEQRLPEDEFVRVDRSTIVNIRKVYRVNQQLRTCTLQAEDGRLLDLQLSKNGVETLLSQVE
ncbi:MAG: LytTR family DNA-binding domain-containing protein [Bacteroidales bacterium]|nr:LytTR family DNA-binding domain-containing protein [Bacteroidales bacterium]